MSVGDEATQEFINECKEMLERIALTLTELEKTGPCNEKYGSIYRDIHTIKGSAQLFGFNQIALIAHSLEASLDPVRKSEIELSVEHVDLTFSGLDIIARILQSIVLDNKEGQFEALVQDFVPRLVDHTTGTLQSPLRFINSTKDSLEEVSSPPEFAAKTVELIATENLRATSPKNLLETATPEKIERILQHESHDGIRVQVRTLDKLMNLVGELILARNQIIGYTKIHAKKSRELNYISQRLSLISAELQSEVMKTRLQPIGIIINPFNRVVRDLGKELGKNVSLRLYGTDTELDKALVEAVKDPLHHILRNAVDHGIETPRERLAKNKAEQGNISINSYHESGQVIIEVSDDGRGLDRDRIAEKAIEKSIITADDFKVMSDRQIFQLIFAPGFSTAKEVSNISGRGVGMDIVKTNIEKIGGIVELSTKPGAGTKIQLKIPLTLAIVPVLVVKVAGVHYAIPQVKLLEVIRVGSAESSLSRKIEVLHGKPVYRLRGQVLSLVDLRGILFPNQSETMNFSELTTVVIVKSSEQAFGIIVDEIQDNADVVVKPLPSSIHNLGLYSGATVLSDGNVALALDIQGVANRAEIQPQCKDEASKLKGRAQDTEGPKARLQFIVFDIGEGGRFSIPMGLVSRIEEFKNSGFETNQQRRTIIYRNKILPIIVGAEYFRDASPDISTYLKSPEHLEPETLYPVIVLQLKDRLLGLQVRRIVDIIEMGDEIDPYQIKMKTMMGSIIHKGQTFTIIDAFELQAGIFVDQEPDKTESIRSQKKTPRLLLVDDSVFFRRHLEKLLIHAGYQVELAEHGAEAWQKLDDPGANYDLVISDIEMPILNGLDLAKRIRGKNQISRTPMIAVTSRFEENDQVEGLLAGFDVYLEKLSEERLINTVGELLLKHGV